VTHDFFLSCLAVGGFVNKKQAVLAYCCGFCRYPGASSAVLWIDFMFLINGIDDCDAI